MERASTDRHPPVHVGLLGRVRATVGGQEVDLGGARQRALLAALGVRAGRTVSTDALIDAVWDGEPPDAAERTFRTYVARLRRSFDAAGADGTAVILTDAAGYRLDDATVAVDARRFEDEIAAARTRLNDGEAAVAAQQVAEALELWEGEALGEFADRSWAAPAASSLTEARTVARELRVEALLDAGRTDRAVTLADELATAEPLREPAARLQAVALYRAGRDADALQVLRRFRDRLVDEHGLDPSPRLATLESMVLDRDPRLDRPVGGRRLRGYVLQEPIARSPLGTVHRAEQPSIGREVAVTVLPPAVADDPDVIRAFETRVQAVAGLDHPHILPVYDYWREPGGAYVVTRFPSAGTLDQRLRGGPLEPRDACRIGEQVAAALAAAHEAGVVHGAVGPDAVVVDDRGDAFLWAFPVAGDTHASADVRAVAELVVEAASPGRAAGAVATEVLPAAAAGPVQQALDPGGEAAPTAALLAAALGAAATGTTAPPLRSVSQGPNPYRGLAAFRETDAGVFFGRDALVDQLRARLARLRAVAVVGPSGAGKSSVVRAGLLPMLRGDGAFVTTMLPGTRPLAELEIALTRVASRELEGIADEVAAQPASLRHVVERVLPAAEGDLVLVVDQFEELFTLTSPTERDLFLQALRAIADDHNARARIVLTLRADFLGQVLAHPVAGPLVRDRSVMVGPLSDDELHEAVVGPAEVAGVAVEPALATAVVADATRFPGSLPMVQFALTEVFEAAADGTMQLAAYRRLGGIEGVLGQRAEEVFTGLDDAAQRAAQVMFQRLVVPNDDGPPTRRRALRSELAHVPEAVLEAFGLARLVRFDHDQDTREPTVEVTHEALFRAWPRLVAWIEEGEDDLRLLGHLTVSATDWDVGGRREADLYRGHRLDAALAFAADRRDELSATERAYLDASTARRARDADADRRSVRRLRALTSGLAVGLVLALIAGTLALAAQRQEAAARADLSETADELADALSDAEAATAREAETARAAQADALAFSATATLGRDRELAALLAAEAHAASPDAGSFAALISVLADDPRVRRVLPIESSICSTLSGQGGSFVVATRPQDGGFIADVRTVDMVPVGEIALSYEPGCPVVDPSGSWLLAGDDATSQLHVFALDSGREVASAPGWRFLGGPDATFHPTEPAASFVGVDMQVRQLRLPDLAVVDEVDVAAGREVFGGVLRYGEIGEGAVVVLFARSDIIAVIDAAGRVIELEASPGSIAGPPALAERAGLVVATVIDGVWVAPVEPGGAFEPVVTRGVPVTAAQISPDGRRMAVGTSAGIEIVDLETLRLVGRPIEVETLGGITEWDGPDRLRMVVPDAVISVDLTESVPAGEQLVEASPAEVGTWPARDGSGAIVFQTYDDWRYLHVESGTSVALGGGLGEQRAVLALAGGRWAVLDPVAGTFEIWSLDGREARTELPSDVVGENVTAENVLLYEDHGVATVIVQRRGGDPRPHLLAFGTTDGSLVASIPLASRPGGAVRDYLPLPGQRFVLTYDTGVLEVMEADGTVVASVASTPGPAGVAGDVDGTRVARGGAEEILVYDIGLTAPVVRMTGLPSAIQRLRFVADDMLLTRHSSGSTLLWDLEEGVLVGAIADLEAYFRYGFAISPDGRAVVHATPTGIARIPLDAAAWADAACGLVGRGLTQDELDAVAPGRTLLDPCGFG